MLKQPPWTLEVLEAGSPPVPFSEIELAGTKPQILVGIKVLELCRIIAGPAIGRTLAEYGADVIKVTSPYLSDVPFFQVDGYVNKFIHLQLFHCGTTIASRSHWVAGLCPTWGVSQCGLRSSCVRLHGIHFNVLSFLEKLNKS